MANLTATAAPGRRRWRLPTAAAVVALLALVVYVVAAVWLRDSLHYAIGDSLARTASAKYVVLSRDPHLAAIGFVWLPLPALVQIPLVLLLEPFGRADLAGPLSTALWAAATVLVVARICRVLGLSRWVRLAVTATFAFNPVVIFFAANGMSEAAFTFFAALALHGYLRWVREQHTRHLIVLGLSLAGAMLVRYETVAIVPILALLAGWHGRRARQWLQTAVIVAAPAIYTFALWLLASWLIKNDPFYWVKGLSETGRPPDDAPWLPSSESGLVGAIGYAARLSFLLAPGLVLLVPALLVGRRRKVLGGLGILGVAAVFPGSIVVLLLGNKTFGNPRYFSPLVLCATIGAAWILANARRTGVIRHAWSAVVIGSLVSAAPVSAVALSSPMTAAVEREDQVFASVLGRERAPFPHQYTFEKWRRLAADLDRILKPGDRVLVETTTGFPAVLFSQHPKAFVISSDRDFEATVSDPAGKVDYVISTSGRAGSGDAVNALLGNADEREAALVEEYEVASVYRLDITTQTRTPRRSASP